MYYKYNKNTLRFEKVNWVKMLLNFVAINVIVFIFVIMNVGLSRPSSITDVTEQELIVINKNHDEFSEEKLEKEIKSYNLKYPYIVHAQSILETGHWTSPIYKENNNLFGMREAKKRPNVALGTKNSHAYYTNWKKSLEDYVLYNASYLFREVDDTEDEYYAYLDKAYAEAKNYSGTLREIVNKYNLKEVYGFDE